VFLLVPAYSGCPGQKPLNGCVCVCVCVFTNSDAAYGQNLSSLRLCLPRCVLQVIPASTSPIDWYGVIKFLGCPSVCAWLHIYVRARVEASSGVPTRLLESPGNSFSKT